SMYVMVYFWSQSMISARGSNPPFGLIFANFMAMLTLGSLCFGYVTQQGHSIRIASQMVQVVSSLSAASLLFTVLTRSEPLRFWSFCIFEYCLGIYLPNMAYLKGNLIGDAHRGKIYGLMRMPINVFVVLCLGNASEGMLF